MEILFVNPPFKAEYGKFSRESRSAMITNSGNIYYPLWLLYAAGVCLNKGYDVDFLDAPAKQMDLEMSMNWIKANKKEYKLFVINTSTPSIYNDANFGGLLKKMYPNAYVILVGTHPTALPEETLKLNADVDFVANGEFDYIVRDLAETIDKKEYKFSDVKGLVYKDNGTVKKNIIMPHIIDMDNLPFASELIKKYLDPKDYFFTAAAYPEIQIFTGRGCPARCYFCVYPQTMHGHNYRVRSVENVVAEFEYIVENFPEVKEVIIEDDTFTIDKDRVEKICDLLIEKGLNRKIRWLCNARANLAYDTMLKMKRAGCRLLIPGIESGSQMMLNNMRKGITLEQIENYVKNAKKAGLLIHACYMVGNRGETRDTMQETLDFAMKLNTDTAQFYTLHPYPGTEAYNWAVENGYLKNDNYENWVKTDGTHNCVISLGDISAEELVEFCDVARKKYYLRPKYIVRKMVQSILSWDEFVRNFKGFINIAPKLLKRK
ncbi:B12-binding domain-containing radical SAM protein [Fusobacterium sp. PH5-44]|uniref:B12-binding domain-containing radical SAM protein n=1 Tax=unclassified Fusobacterium TaxID=2648384 RepID=UPI003D202BFB